MDPRRAEGRRRNPIEQLGFFGAPTTAGKVSRARSRAAAQKEEVTRTNRAICALRQLWAGSLDGSLLGTADSAWKASEFTSVGGELAHLLRARVRDCIAKRPKDAPMGAAAVARQLGVRPQASGPPRKAGAQASSSLPKRGDVWPAMVANIALPPAGTAIVPIREVSQKAKFYLDAFQEKMLISASEREALSRDVPPEDLEPYVDPALRAQMISLAVRMAQANMLVGVRKVRSTVGLFTVVKKILDPAPGSTEHRIVLRLVFDQRQPNKLWQRPPPVALAGPGAMSSFEVPPGARLAMATGDIPDWYYRLGLSRRIAEWFCLPGVTFPQLIRELKRLGDTATMQALLASGADSQGLGMSALPMGWSWAVFLAQSALQEMVAGAVDPWGAIIFEPHRSLIEGAPPPLLSRAEPRLHSEYIDDYCLIILTWAEDLDEVQELARCVRAALEAKGFPVHKEECGFTVRTLGHDLGGDTPRCEAAPEKLWLAIEVLWELAIRGRGVPSVVESTLALTSWLFMTKRPALSIFEETYAWVREHREERHRQELPRMVRRELAAASAILPLVGQNLAIPWHPTALMFDASDWGGGVVSTQATQDELRREGRWAVRGGWVTAFGDPETLRELRQPEVQEADYGIEVVIPRGVPIPTYVFWHLFSGHRRQYDLEWYLLRLGGLRGQRIIVENFDLGYGEQYDLGADSVIEDLVERAGRRECDGMHTGPPCSTWSRARFRPGGPPPLRDRDRPWGRLGLSGRERRHVDEHSELMRNSCEVYGAVAEAGGEALHEHPADPGRHPYPSIFATTYFMELERRARSSRITFPQCMLGAPSRKDTTLSGTPGLRPGLELFPVKCAHATHEQLIGLDESGRFKTRRAQSYPPEMCEKMAQAFVIAFAARPPLSGTYFDPEASVDDSDGDGDHDDDAANDIIGRELAPEVGREWDDLSRWKEETRWAWKRPEHNNLLEARAGLAALNLLAMDRSSWGRRLLLISDSMVVIGAMSKGRSSRKVLNLIARRVAALVIGLDVRVAWRYVRTHRNHSDGPSRNCPLGVAPSDKPVAEAPMGSWRELPRFFYSATTG